MGKRAPSGQLRLALGDIDQGNDESWLWKCKLDV